MKELMEKAVKAMKTAYAPYSGFQVGAALLCADGTVYTGCNIENAAYSVTVCAERVALFKAVSDGKKDFTALAVCGGKNGVITEICTPCGVCRQALAEFCSPDMPVYLITKDGYEQTTLGQLLPQAFPCRAKAPL